MQELAASYLEHFDMTFGEDARIVLSGDAPDDLVLLARSVEEMFGPGKLVCLFEALSVVADAELPHCAEVDVKVCPLDLYFIVVDYLGSRAFPNQGGV